MKSEEAGPKAGLAARSRAGKVSLLISIVAVGACALIWFNASRDLHRADPDQASSAEPAADEPSFRAEEGLSAVTPLAPNRPNRPAVVEIAPANVLPAAEARPPADTDPFRNALNTRFMAEERDPTWSDAETSHLAQELAPVMPAGSVLVDIDCRQSLCLILAKRSADGSFDQFADGFRHIRVDDWAGGMAVLRPEDPGSDDIVAFVGRPGNPPPEFGGGTIAFR